MLAVYHRSRLVLARTMSISNDHTLEIIITHPTINFKSPRNPTSAAEFTSIPSVTDLQPSQQEATIMSTENARQKSAKHDNPLQIDKVRRSANPNAIASHKPGLQTTTLNPLQPTTLPKSSRNHRRAKPNRQRSQASKVQNTTILYKSTEPSVQNNRASTHPHKTPLFQSTPPNLLESTTLQKFPCIRKICKTGQILHKSTVEYAGYT